jgi:RHS repeat-associated protein
MTFYQDDTTPLKSTSIPGYDVAGLFQTLTANLPLGTSTQVVKNVQYTALGQRSEIDYGNGSSTTYTYDQLTQRMLTLVTVRPDGCKVQNLSYVYDAAGNITNIMDAAQQTVYFNNTVVDPSSSYIYDALNRLVQATGREYLGQIGSTAPGPWDPDAGSNGQDSRNGTAMARYTESYYYDQVDNIQSVRHEGSAASTPGWTRNYTYAETSPLQPGRTNNRLSSTSVGNTTSQYTYDGAAGVSGCITSMPHLSVLNWGFNDMIQAAATQKVNSGTPETTYFQYDGTNARSRKVTNRQAAVGATPVRKSERIYIGPFEIYREFAANGTDIALERQSYSLTDGTRRVVLAETRTVGDASSDPAPQQLLRYQFTNHLNSSCLELDTASAIITYEEYTPLGSSSYRTTEGNVETPKRYRYASKERDDETGFYDYGARCYAPWLGRWISADPAGISDGFNVYAFVRNNPIMKGDANGMQSEGDQQNMSWFERQRASASAWVQSNPYARGALNGVGNAINNLKTPKGALMLAGGVVLAAAAPEAALVMGAFALGYAVGRVGRATYDAVKNPTDQNKERVGEVLGEEGTNAFIAIAAGKIGGAGGSMMKEDILPALARVGEEGFGPKLATAGAEGGGGGGIPEAPRPAPAESSPLELQSSSVKGGVKSGGGTKAAAPKAPEGGSGGGKPAPKEPVQPRPRSKSVARVLEKVGEFLGRSEALTDKAIERGDPDYLKRFGVKNSDIRGLSNPNIKRAVYGRIVERVLAHLIQSSSDLRVRVEYIANVKGQGEMFRGIGEGRLDFTFESSTGRMIKIDITTKAAWLAHFLRPGFKGTFYFFHSGPKF